MNIFIITSTWKFNKNTRVMLSRKRRTLHLTGFAYICCFIVDKTRSHNTKNVSQFLFCFRFLLFACFVFKVKLVVSFCYLSVISDICEPCLGGEGYQYPVSLKQYRKISHIPKIDFRSKAKNIPKNTQNDNAISHIPVIQRTHIPYPKK
jgi:predicted membrane protein